MSISPPSDIVLDVAKAADPAKSLAATERLARLGPTSAAGAQTFSDALGQTRLAADSALRSPSALFGQHGAPAAASVDPRLKVYKGLESLLLQNLVETMLPTDTESLFGKGMAGDVWRSMLAEKLATQLSSRVDLGIASAAYRVHPPLPLGGGESGAPPIAAVSRSRDDDGSS